jgi:hypothetical protein
VRNIIFPTVYHLGDALVLVQTFMRDTSPLKLVINVFEIKPSDFELRFELLEALVEVLTLRTAQLIEAWR